MKTVASPNITTKKCPLHSSIAAAVFKYQTTNTTTTTTTYDSLVFENELFDEKCTNYSKSRKVRRKHKDMKFY